MKYLGNGNSGRYSYDPKTGRTIQQPSGLTETVEQDIMEELENEELYREIEQAISVYGEDAVMKKAVSMVRIELARA